MSTLNSELIPYFHNDDSGPIEPFPIYVTKTTLRSILKKME